MWSWYPKTTKAASPQLSSGKWWKKSRTHENGEGRTPEDCSSFLWWVATKEQRVVAWVGWQIIKQCFSFGSQYPFLHHMTFFRSLMVINSESFLVNICSLFSGGGEGSLLFVKRPNKNCSALLFLCSKCDWDWMMRVLNEVSNVFCFVFFPTSL